MTRMTIEGQIRVTEWCDVMSSAFNGGADLPWLSLRSKLVKMNSSGMVEYRSTFDDFKVQLKYTNDVRMQNIMKSYLIF
jgi:hypothetical protein